MNYDNLYIAFLAPLGSHVAGAAVLAWVCRATAMRSLPKTSMPLGAIRPYIDEFLSFAMDNNDMNFHIVAIGCGLAGYSPEDIVPLFGGAPDNCFLPHEFKSILARKE